MIKLFLSDLDGTLMDEKMQMKDTDIEAIHRLHETTVRFGIVTGRDVGIYHHYIHPVLEFDMDYIGNNGGSILATGKKIYEMNMNTEDVYEMMKYVGDYYLEETYPFIADDHCNFYFHKKVPKDNFWCDTKSFMAQVGHVSEIDILEYLKNPQDKVIKASFYTREKDPTFMSKILRERYGDKFEITMSANHFAEMTTKGIHKGTAIQKLLEHHRLNADEVAVIGDGENDIPMFKMFPKHAFVMASAKPEIKAYGRVVDSVSQAINILLEEEKS
ncbi:Cof subfamily protein (haloacid dehalogenase superfamily) [Breznakia sp. PF5-3]|uniref:Cof-type HAD-IIB family hydrolase n=1 Tax=unclassified Breznakia TaxID=2623764 RepID=UPI002405B66C|nr:MULTISPECIES: Cof-type HAD-IIB family hydrolase [unclassified Breznakia]MDF9823820.1 Cof subfamily protein (haloacid dehalogenase superfamily) [Breznakia sp. PM6-1]MDF9834614.1 Cof subfamily protein (haloacid dehalogenase superfamily) [Breznakia sp. PF5-3]MDF9836769.1 Cof subfamily protein (haloacid dehalogenase superfamily) [Breznakia sp. PFB2-8]MDF9858782.1 Cof subfamily protein (haloacid dehalogenase superfamily) [Breznakia sp. PH5-24]